jgi:hypothetical protein
MFYEIVVVVDELHSETLFYKVVDGNTNVINVSIAGRNERK